MGTYQPIYILKSQMPQTWGWIRKSYLKNETKDLIFAAHEQSLRTNWIRKNIDGQEVSEKCRMWGERESQ